MRNVLLANEVKIRPCRPVEGGFTHHAGGHLQVAKTVIKGVVTADLRQRNVVSFGFEDHVSLATECV